MEIVTKLQGKTYKWKKIDLSNKAENNNAAQTSQTSQEASTEKEDLLDQGELAGRNVFGLIAQEVQR